MNQPWFVENDFLSGVINQDEMQRYHEVFDTQLSDLNRKYIDCLLSDSCYVSMCIQVVIWTSIGWLFVCTDAHHLASVLPKALHPRQFLDISEDCLWYYQTPE